MYLLELLLKYLQKLLSTDAWLYYFLDFIHSIQEAIYKDGNLKLHKKQYESRKFSQQSYIKYFA